MTVRVAAYEWVTSLVHDDRDRDPVGILVWAL